MKNKHWVNESYLACRLYTCLNDQVFYYIREFLANPLTTAELVVLVNKGLTECNLEPLSYIFIENILEQGERLGKFLFDDTRGWSSNPKIKYQGDNLK